MGNVLWDTLYDVMKYDIMKFEVMKQAGAELGQAQLKLRLDFN